jgi:hypothetical protein
MAFHTSNSQSYQNSNPSRVLILYLIANMSNSWFTEVAREKKPLKSVIYKCTQNVPSRNIPLLKTVGFKHFEKGKETCPVFTLSSPIVCKPFESCVRPRPIIFLQGAHFLGLVALLLLK